MIRDWKSFGIGIPLSIISAIITAVTGGVGKVVIGVVQFLLSACGVPYSAGSVVNSVVDYLNKEKDIQKVFYNGMD